MRGDQIVCGRDAYQTKSRMYQTLVGCNKKLDNDLTQKVKAKKKKKKILKKKW